MDQIYAGKRISRCMEQNAQPDAAGTFSNRCEREAQADHADAKRQVIHFVLGDALYVKQRQMPQPPDQANDNSCYCKRASLFQFRL